jgi:hypothetical protein
MAANACPTPSHICLLLCIPHPLFVFPTGVQKPDGWPAHEDPFDAETEDEEAEEFHHMYYTIMRRWAGRGNPWAQKEYAMMLRK